MARVNKAEKEKIEQEYMTLNELCELFHFSRMTAKRLLSTPDFPCIRIGKIYRIHREKLAKWQEANMGKTVLFDEEAAISDEN